MAPDGLVYVSSWVDEKLERCYQVMKTHDPRLLNEWMANWKDLTDFEVYSRYLLRRRPPKRSSRNCRVAQTSVSVFQSLQRAFSLILTFAASSFFVTFASSTGS